MRHVPVKFIRDMVDEWDKLHERLKPDVDKFTRIGERSRAQHAAWPDIDEFTRIGETLPELFSPDLSIPEMPIPEPAVVQALNDFREEFVGEAKRLRAEARFSKWSHIIEIILILVTIFISLGVLRLDVEVAGLPSL